MKTKYLHKFFVILLTILFTSTQAFALKINEVMPNPEGKDEGNEWIEIYNDESHTINLEGWHIQNKKKAYLKGVIGKEKYLILKNIKTTLKNSNEEILLVDKNNNVVDKIKYTKSKQGLSLSKIKIGKTDSTTEDNSAIRWIWISPSPGKANPEYHEFEGEIIAEPQIEKDFYFILAENERERIITFEEDEFEFNNMLAILKPGSTVKVLVEEQNNKFLLKDLRIIEKATNIATQKEKISTINSNNGKIKYILLLTIPLSIICIYGYTKS